MSALMELVKEIGDQEELLNAQLNDVNVKIAHAVDETKTAYLVIGGNSK
jgi:hypothetical protein